MKMTKKQFKKAEEYMLENTEEMVHDQGHVYRVLYNAMRICNTEPAADKTVVMLSALLHDIGRRQDTGTDKMGHAERGSMMAYDFLRGENWPEQMADHVRACILTHSRGGGKTPASLEAKILFDADKLDLCGAMGVARMLQFGVRLDEPLYQTDQTGAPLFEKNKEKPSAYGEYLRKLRKMEKGMFTAEGRRLAAKRQPAIDGYFKALKGEVKSAYAKGGAALEGYWKG